MNIVTTTSVYPPCTELLRAAQTLRGIGFGGADIAFDYCVQEPDFPFMTDAYADWASALRRMADDIGLIFSHGHAPFDASCRTDLVRRTLHCCQILGIRYLVVHPIWRDSEGSILHDDAAFIEINREAILPLLAIAAEYGVTLLSENLLWGASARAETIAALVDATAHRRFGWCYDTGHAKALGYSPAVLHTCTVPLSLHIQDNHGRTDGLYDDHLLPGDGAIDWKELLDTLKAIGYAGDVVLEAHHQPLEARSERERKSILIDLYMRADKMRSYLCGA